MFYAYRIRAAGLAFVTLLVVYPCSAKKSQPRTERIEKMSNNSQNQKKWAQEPKPPYPYLEEEVTYENKAAGITLAGTLTLPRAENPVPAVLLISGMGPNDRNAASFDGHRLFLVVADYLTRQGIAVLRVDKRGIGKSTGTYDLSLTSADFAADTLAGVNYLTTRKEIKQSQIGLIGHSEGGMIAPMVAVKTSAVAFVIMLAGVASTSPSILGDQIGMQLRADGASDDLIAQNAKVYSQLWFIVKNDQNATKAEKECLDAVKNYWGALPVNLQEESARYIFAINGAKAAGTVAMINSPWYRYCLAHNPAKILEQVKVPVLALYGSLDFIVMGKHAFPIIAQAFEKTGNTQSKMLELPGLNHRFQNCKTGGIKECMDSDETIAPAALKVVGDWIAEITV